MSRTLYVDSSAALSAALDQPGGADLRRTLGQAGVLVTSRLAQVETARALVRLRVTGELPRAALTSAAAALRGLWERSYRWELTAEVCTLAMRLAPNRALRSLDALHLATFVLARRDEPTIELLTKDKRLAEAAAEIK